MKSERIVLASLAVGLASLGFAGSSAVHSAVLPAVLSWGDDEGLALFESEVRPALIEHCVECHSGEKPKGGLRLDSVDGIRAGAHGEPIFVASAPDDSLMVEAVRHDDPLVAMPPSEKIPDDAILAIERWIELGAPLPEAMDVDEDATLRWCFRAPLDVAPPVVTGAASTGIDQFLMAEIEAMDIVPSPMAALGPWLRRATFDVTGLPPTPLEIDAFLADADVRGHAAAREAAVDRLLASPAYGERWARRWLDLTRYAETKAHEFDFPIPNAFVYRDYVIRAFDADVPYDRFVTEFLAGDLVEAPRLDPTGTFDESPLGTGAWFLGEEVHSPVEPRGDQTDRIAHQVEVLSKSVLALGVACARCHDHKFDPISAEDYHALSGFALSTSPRQLRFETDVHNRRIAAQWEHAEDVLQPLARTAVARALEAEADALGAWLESGLRQVELSGPAVAIDSDAVAAFDAAARGSGLGGPGRLPLLIEDFESETFKDSAIGPWEVTGDAFLSRPLRAADVTSSQADLDMRGAGCVNSYAGHPKADGFSADTFEGTLTSAPFPIVRAYLHFLIDGGDLETTRVELIDAESGDVLHTARGVRTNRFHHRRFDVRAIEGQMVRLRFVDEEPGGWGQIGGDHVVQSDDADASSLDLARSLTTWTSWIMEGTSAGELTWIDALYRVKGQGSGPVALRSTQAAAADPAADPSELLVDYSALEGPRWIVNGPAFGTKPRRAGDVVLDLTTGDAPLVQVAAIVATDAAVAHPAWSDLTVAPSSSRRAGNFNWVQAGRTLLSPNFRVETERIAHLVRGKGSLITPIASHRMLSGPLHQGSIARFDTKGEWRWITQRMASAIGLHAHVEVTNTGQKPLEIARTVSLPDGETLPDPRAAGWLAERFEDVDDSERSTSSDLALLLRDAAQLVQTGGVAGRALSDVERRALFELAEFVAQTIPPAKERIARDLSRAGEQLAGFDAQRRLSSRLALAAVDLDGRDERVLDRGSWRTPLDPAPRRSLAKLRSDDAPLAERGGGSGRLALAQDLVASESGIVQRVWVNRVWHSMFGRGIVETTDDFGAMGAKPTHPELLDRLARDFAAEGWSTKALIKKLMMTDAYARSTAPTESARALDPNNKLLSHMRVRRLEAEEVRDALLAVSGELDRTRFGKPVPIHLTPFMTGRGRPGSSGPLDGNRRRSIYLEVRRNFPHPLLSVFDQPSPSTCHGRRTTANVPAQALALLNDPFVEERAAALAASLPAGTPEESADALWRRTLGRAPSAEERGVALAHAEAAGANGWVDLAHTLFNVKEFCFLESEPFE